MTPNTVHMIAQEIRNERGRLTSLEKWARTWDSSQAKMDVFHYINFKRRMLALEEREISTGNVHNP